MKGIFNRVPPLASDYSGACSVLFAIYSLNLLYSPGGCSSAVIECDEIRDLRRTLFFSSKLGELEAVMGAEEEFLLHAETLCARNRFAEFISVIGTPVPALTGVDLEAIAEKLGRRTGLPALAFHTEGFENYYSGVHHALLTLGRRFLERREKKNNRVNIIGYTPLSLGVEAHLAELIEALSRCGLEIGYPPADKIELEAFKGMSSAALNIVVSHEGAGLAQYMHREYSIPYVMNVPAGLWGMRRLFHALEGMLGIPSSAVEGRYALVGKAQPGQRAVVIGEPLFASCMATCLQNDFGFDHVEPAALMKADRRMKRVYQEEALSGVRFFECEETLTQWLDGMQTDVIVGDPLYQGLVRRCNVQYVPIPHVGLSGVVYAGANYEFIGKGGYDFLSRFIGI